ncbi:hypothetical protein D9M68_661580 [compost metagenome]
MLGQHVLVEHGDRVAEDDRVGDLHHGGLQVHREQHALGAGVVDLGLQEGRQLGGGHDGGVDDLAGLDRGLVLEDGDGAIGGDQFDLHVAGVGDQRGLLGAVEVAFAHVRDVRLGAGGPGAHLVRVLAGVVLDRQRGAAVGVAFTQDRVHGAALDLVVARLDVAFGVVGGGVRVVGQLVALLLQFLDGGLQLRHRGADVGQLDDVGFRLDGQGAEFGEGIAQLLAVFQVVREHGDDAAGEGNVAGLDRDAGGFGEGLDDGQQRTGCERRRFVGEGIDNLRSKRHDP